MEFSNAEAPNSIPPRKFKHCLKFTKFFPFPLFPHVGPMAVWVLGLLLCTEYCNDCSEYCCDSGATTPVSSFVWGPLSCCNCRSWDWVLFVLSCGGGASFFAFQYQGHYVLPPVQPLTLPRPQYSESETEIGGIMYNKDTVGIQLQPKNTCCRFGDN